MSHELADFIPTKSNYIEREIGNMKDIELLKRAYEGRRWALLVGDTGTGKSAAIRHLAAKMEVPYLRVGLNGGIVVEDLVGQWIPAKSGKGYIWQDGVLTRFLRHGGVIVIDEINACPAEILFILHGILDDERRVVLTQKDGEVVKAHDDFMLFATMNPDYEGTRPLNAALKDRFEIIVQYDYDEKIETEIVMDGKLITAARNLRVAYNNGELATPVSTRTLLQYERNREAFGEEVARHLFYCRFSAAERSAAQAYFELVMGDI